MGCRGVVRILLETVSTNSFIFNYTSEMLSRRMTFTMATLINADGARKPGQRLYIDEYGTESSDFNEAETLEILTKLRRAFIERRTGIENFSFGEVFIETITPPLNLLLFGAGFDALPLVKFAKELGWRVSVVDHRPAYANSERLPEADEIFVAGIKDLNGDFFEDENSVAVVMTHNIERDREILPRLLKSRCLYIGALGPKKRTEKILSEAGEDFSATQFEKLHAPVGLDIGADTPEAIALSIVAEILTILKNRTGGFLRERKSSIYGRDVSEPPASAGG
jgi:xanthine/CO dehydrogenase XdhC/CoxF family maturation factor